MSSAPLAALLLAASCFCVDGHHVPEGDVPLAHVHYTVWDGREHAIKVCGDIGLLLPENSTFYTVMTDAARISAYFRFKSDVMHGQHYITSIGGKKYDQKKGYYWMIYKLPYHPDPSVPLKDVLLTPKGVDRTYISDGDFYLFSLKKVAWAQMNNATS